MLRGNSTVEEAGEELSNADVDRTDSCFGLGAAETARLLVTVIVMLGLGSNEISGLKIG